MLLLSQGNKRVAMANILQQMCSSAQLNIFKGVKGCCPDWIAWNFQISMLNKETFDF